MGSVTLLPELRKRPVAAQLHASASKPFVEVLVGQRLMAVTIEGGSLSWPDVALTVTRASVRLSSRSDPNAKTIVIALPMSAEPGRYWARFNHGVCDILVARAERSA
jgi:hypothetical protein